MKTLRKIGMAFLAVVLCVSFSACSDDDDDEPSLNVESLDGTWAVKEKNGIEYDDNGNQEAFHEVYDVDHPEEGDKRISFLQSTGGTFLYVEYEYSSNEWLEYDSETIQFENNTIHFSFGDRKVLKLDAKTLVLFEAADADHVFTEEVTTTYVRVK